MSHLDFFVAVMSWCYRFQGSITSWGRTEKHNASVGGVNGSRHTLFKACDVVYDVLPDIVDRKQVAMQLGLTLVVENDHDHLQG